jgi:cobyric acid synthase
MQPEKTVRRVAASIGGATFDAYEIHMGQTTLRTAEEGFARVNGSPEGVRAGRCIGTYLHDALRSPAVLGSLGIRRRDNPSREEPYDALARWFDENADTRLFEELYLQ